MGKLVAKMFNLLVVLALLLQPVGTVGLYGAFSYGQGVAQADTEPVETEATATEEEPAPVEEVEPAEEPEEPAPVVEETPVEVPVIPAPEKEVVPTPETLPEEAPVVEAPEVIPTEEVVEEDIKSQPEEESEWNKEEDGRYATTKVVVLGTTYVAPQNEDVTVVFTKLPEHPGTLSIEEVKLSPEQVVELGALSDTAYDVTSSMEDGTFEYVLTLPVPAHGGETVVKYAEDVAGLTEAGVVADEDTASDKHSVAVTLDHFTIFVATYASDFTTSKNSYQQGDTVYLKATGLSSGNYYRFAIDPPGNGNFSYVTTCQTGNTTLTGTYVLAGNAPTGNNWKAEIHGFTSSNSCNNANSQHNPSDDSTFAVTEAPQHVAVTICHATPPDTAANGYTKLVTDDDGVLNQGHASQHGADIIPPFVVGNTNYPGKNWDTTGQAIWNNNCIATGSLKAVKVVDDGSLLTAWSFQLDNNAPIAANASGVVDFGTVPVGPHTITEIGQASYTMTGVSGTNCALLGEGTGASATVVANTTTVCTFSNAVNRGSITIVKDALPNDAQDFAFTTSLEESDFTLDDDGDNENGVSNTTTFGSLLPGTYSFTEEAVAGWSLQGMSCVSSNVSLDLPVSATATVTLHPGENVTCTYTNVKVPYCGDGIVNNENEQCDGVVEGGEYTCSETCQLVANPGTLHVTKVVINDDGGDATPDDFSFSLNEGEAISFEADGVNDVVVPAGAYTVEETPVMGYAVSYSKACSDLVVPPGGDAYCTITNNDAPIQIEASKVICTDEADLPNWGLGGPDITASTASNWVATHESCRLERDWQFQWSYDGVGNPGDNLGAVGSDDWHTFVGTTTVPLAVFDQNQAHPVWVREVWDDNYIPFTYGTGGGEDPNSNNVSAEMYCYKDVLNYDNWDWVEHPVAGGTYHCVAWNVGQPGQIIVKKETDPAGSDEQFVFSSSFTEGNFFLADGETYTSSSLTPGQYSVTEAERIGWRLDDVTCSDGSDPESITLDPGETVTCTFKNQATARIIATKIVCADEADLPNYGLGGPDMTISTATDWVNTHESCRFEENWRFQWAYESNANPGDNTGESANPDWHTFGPTGVNGQTSTDVDLKSSALLWVREVWDDQYIPFTYGNNPEDWNSDNVSAELYCHQDVQNYDNYDFIDAGTEAPAYYCVAWNVAKREEAEPRLELRKSNNSVGDETPGNTVTYTLEVTALDGPVEDVTVTDLPPEGFAYVAGSGEGAPFIHEYASPGIWDLGDMAAGETKVLTYETTISSAQDDGRYKDLAFARGTSGSNTIFANSVADPFVGTEVSVVSNDTETVVIPEDNENKIVEKTKKKTAYVLGAATTLPMTGVPFGTVVLALLGLVFGLALILVSRRRALVPVIALMMFGGALFPHTADAASLSVKIETPEAVTDTASIKIGFVTLDVLGRSLTVECYRDSDVVPFASYTLASTFGGNSGDCQVDGSVMPTDGSYEFYVKAIASGEGSETVESNHVTVTLSSATPGLPYDYDRDDASCQNNITFMTADDGGKTVKVELYRSFSTTFVADAGTKVAELMIGSNLPGSFSVPAPGCSNDAYYAIRAVAGNGNGSGFVGDKDTNVDTHTVTKNKTTTVTLPGGNVSGAIPVTNTTVGTPEGQVEGVTDEEGDSNTETTPEPSVLGDMTEAGVDAVTNHPWRSFFWLVTVLVVAYFVYQWYRSKDHDQSAN